MYVGTRGLPIADRRGNYRPLLFDFLRYMHAPVHLYMNVVVKFASSTTVPPTQHKKHPHHDHDEDAKSAFAPRSLLVQTGSVTVSRHVPAHPAERSTFYQATTPSADLGR